MLKLVTGMQNSSDCSRGFTLIEILVVVLIVGITIGFALLAFGDFGSKRRIVMATEQFVNYVKLVQHQAILETSTLGISVDHNNYQVLRLNSTAGWQSMAEKSVFHQQHFPESTIVRFDNLENTKKNPQIIINSSGDMTAFTLTISSGKEIDIANIMGKSNGAVVIQWLPLP